MNNKYKKRIIIINIIVIIILLFIIILTLSAKNDILSKIVKNAPEAQESAFDISYKIVDIDDDYTYILVIVEDEQNGITEVIRPDNFTIECNDKTKVGIDYKVEVERDYVFTATNGNGEVINKTINVPIEKPAIKVKNEDLDRFTIEVTSNYSKNIVTEYKYYVNGQLRNSGTKNKSYTVTGLEKSTTYDVYVEACFNVDEIVLTSDTIQATTTDTKTLSTDITRWI